MVKAPAVNALTVGTPLTCKIVMVHNNPPFWPPVFLGANYIIHKTIEKSIVCAKNKKSAVLLTPKSSIQFLKNFSFLLLQNMVRADVFTGSLAVFRFAAKPLIFCEGFLAAAGGEMRSNYFKNGAPRRKSQCLAARDAPLGDQIVWNFRGKKKFPIPLKSEKKNFSKS